MSEFIPSGIGGLVTGPTRTPGKRTRSEEFKDEQEPPGSRGRARRNMVPGPAALKNLIDQALNAMRNGIYWDRGSIINIVL